MSMFWVCLPAHCLSWQSWCGVEWGKERRGKFDMWSERGREEREGETMFGGLAKQSDNLVHGINQLICKYVR